MIARLRLLIVCCVTPICAAMSASGRSFKKSCSTSQRSDFDRRARACLRQESKAAGATELNSPLSELFGPCPGAKRKAYAHSCRQRVSVPVSTRWWTKALNGTLKEGSYSHSACQAAHAASDRISLRQSETDQLGGTRHLKIRLRQLPDTRMLLVRSTRRL